jgi:hypothetical protein
MSAQADTDYNRKGDQALQRHDYMDARMWYSEGIEDCDKYSIRRLTTLWNNQASMRSSMHVLMSRCFECLGNQVLSGDTDAMLSLSEYYKKGIGVEIDTIKSEFWEKRAMGLYIGGHYNGKTNATIIDTIKVIDPTPKNATKKEPFYKDFEYFVSYSPSWLMPAGISFGILNDGKLGFYLDYRMNLDLTKSELECENGIIPGLDPNLYAKSEEATERWNHYMITTGVIFPVINNAFITLGAGYGRRDLYRRIPVGTKLTEELSLILYRDIKDSYQGVSMQLGGSYRYKYLIFSGGINSISFKDLDGYVGLGYVF